MQPPTPRLKKQDIFNQDCTFTKEIIEEPNLSEDIMNSCCKQIHTYIVQNHLTNRKPNKQINSLPPDINPDEKPLTKSQRRTLAQLRTDKSPFLLTYLHKINPTKYTSSFSICPLCTLQQEHTTSQLFQCPKIPTQLSVSDLWDKHDDLECDGETTLIAVSGRTTTTTQN